jgi:glycerophosphoryl diester phosphodiesterase
MGIRVLAHRGYWLAPAERNSLAAFERAFAGGYGIEFDVRDLDGELVVSHDPPRHGALPLGDVIELWKRSQTAGTLAVNVKSDGLQGALAAAITGDWFAFDMSVPDTLGYLRSGLPTFTRHSDVEPDPVLYQHAHGVWLDDFGGGWLRQAHVERHLAAGKSVAVVSPELHGRDHAQAWREWRTWSVWREPQLHLCTDHPREAEEAFR